MAEQDDEREVSRVYRQLPREEPPPELDAACVAALAEEPVQRPSARALAESLPYLRQASKVGILVIEGESKTEADPLKGNDAVLHLRHHGINAVKYRAIAEEDEIADALIAECRTLNANLLVMGSYGHSRLHELLPGSTTDRVLHRSPFPLLIAH